MITPIIKIGNSRGIRIPKTVLEQTGLNNQVELEVEDKKIIISAPHHPRNAWKKAFQQMAEKGDDVLIDQEFINAPSSWDKIEWTW